MIERASRFLAHRFPSLEGVPPAEVRACQVTQSIDSHFVVDRHPGLANTWIVGGGSGHGFKHGPSVGEFLAQRIAREETDPELQEAWALKQETF